MLALTVVMVAPAAEASTPPVSFGPHAEYGGLIHPSSVAVGDLDGDGFDDLIVGATNGLTGSAVVLLADGEGGLDPQTSLISGVVSGLSVGDVNGDSALDVAVNNDYLENVSLLLGDGSGGFGSATVVATSAVSPTVMGDVSGDGFVDLVVARSTGVSVLIGDGAGGFVPGADVVTGFGLSSMVMGDATGDGFVDLVVAGSTTVSVLVGDGAGGFEQGATVPGAGVSQSALDEVDGDGDVDLVVGGSTGVSVSLGDGAGGFAPLSPVAAGASLDALVDLNGDGFRDIVDADFSSDSVSVRLANGTGAFGAPVAFATAGGPAAAAGANLNGDAYPDLAVVVDNFNLDAVSVLLNTSGDPRVPDAPTIIKNATAGNAEATVSWTAPASDGGSPILGYVVTPYVGYYAFPSVTYNSTATTQVVTGRVINGLTYRFRVQAINAVGTSAYSKVTNAVFPSTAVAPDLGAPTIVRDATGGSAQATVSWTAPVSDGGSPVTGYVVTPYVGYFQFPSYTFHSTATTQTVTSLSSGFTYRFRVQAVNAVGTGASSKVSNPVAVT